MNKNWEKEHIDRLVDKQQKNDQLQAEIENDFANKS